MYEKERKWKFEMNIGVKMCHIQRITVNSLIILHVYLDLATPCQKKSEIGLPPIPPLVAVIICEQPQLFGNFF